MTEHQARLQEAKLNYSAAVSEGDEYSRRRAGNAIRTLQRNGRAATYISLRANGKNAKEAMAMTGKEGICKSARYDYERDFGFCLLCGVDGKDFNAIVNLLDEHRGTDGKTGRYKQIIEIFKSKDIMELAWYVCYECIHIDDIDNQHSETKDATPSQPNAKVDAILQHERELFGGQATSLSNSSFSIRNTEFCDPTLDVQSDVSYESEDSKNAMKCEAVYSLASEKPTLRKLSASQEVSEPKNEEEIKIVRGVKNAGIADSTFSEYNGFDPETGGDGMWNVILSEQSAEFDEPPADIAVQML